MGERYFRVWLIISLLIGALVFMGQSCQQCTDNDKDGFFIEGDNCGEIDCDDTDASINPSATEVCDDEVDNNCDGDTDEGCSSDGDDDDSVCTDNDGDGYAVEGGNCGEIDCDDTDADVNPGAAEMCDDGPEIHLCNQGFSFGFLHLDAAASAPTLDTDLELVLLGASGVQNLLDNLVPYKNTFCGVALSDDAAKALEEFIVLLEAGDTEATADVLENMLNDLQQNVLKLNHTIVLSRQASRLSKDQAYSYIQAFLSMAAEAQLLGLDDLADDAMDAAIETFSDWATDAIQNTTDLSQALEIAAGAQLLGLENLSDDALEKAGEIIQQRYTEAFNAFDPCDATEAEARDLLTLAALRQLLEGSEVDSAVDKVKEWKDIKERQDKGEAVPECDARQIDIDVTFADGLVAVSGTAYTCDGTNWHIDISTFGVVSGVPIQSSGALDFIVVDGQSGKLILEVTGTATFDDNVQSFKDPLTFMLTIQEDGEAAQLSLSSTGQGTIQTPIGPIPFVSVPGGGTVEVELIPHLCDN
jgi:hypothetical protein